MHGAVPVPAADVGVLGEEASTLETVMEVLDDGYQRWPRFGQVSVAGVVSRTMSVSQGVLVSRGVPVSRVVPGPRTTPGDLIRAGRDHPRLHYRDVRERRRPCHRREGRWGAQTAPEPGVDPPPF